MSTRRSRAWSALIATTLAIVAAPASPSHAAEACTGFGPVEAGPRVVNPAIIELSGLAASRAHPGVLWAHNDSGDQARVFAIGEDGADLGTYAVEGAEAVDWEDVAVGPGPDAGRSYLYLADIGDNDAQRPSVTVYRVPEPETAPEGAGGTLVGAEPLTITYPGGPADAEALLVDPPTGDLVIVTKDLLGGSLVLTAPADQLMPGTPIELREAGVLQIAPSLSASGLPGTMVTAADVAPDGSLALVRTYQDVLAFERPAGTSLADALLGEGCAAPAPVEPQGEAIAFLADGSAYVTASEVQRAVDGGELAPGSTPTLSRVELAEPVAPTTVAPSTSGTPSTTTNAPVSPEPSATQPRLTEPSTTDDDSSSTGWVVAGVVAIVVLAGGIAWGLARRRRAT